MKTELDFLAEFYSDHMYADDTIGSVDELGYYALVEIGDEAEQAEVYADFATEPLGRFYEPGWYIIQSDSQGFTHAGRYTGETAAKQRWDQIYSKYDEYWQREDEYESTNGYEDLFGREGD